MADLTDIRDSVRDRYAEAAKAATEGRPGCGCERGCAPASPYETRTDASGEGVFGGALYPAGDAEVAPKAALDASLGCGVPTGVADLQEGDTALDLGSGAGADVLISARRVGPKGTAIGLDMTEEMLDLARSNARAAGVKNVEFVKGYIEDMPLPDASVDVVISNCVINLSGDKAKVIAEAARVLRPGGRFAVSDVIADEDMDDKTRADMAAWTGCIAGALTEREFVGLLVATGFEDVEVRSTHRVHAHASSAIIRARKPEAAECCDADAQSTCCEPVAKSACCGSVEGHATGACGCR
jgi:SAM-dependent methyltransferase